MTTRPQFGSSPAIAVFKIGELAQDERDFARRLPGLRALDLEGHELRQALRRPWRPGWRDPASGRAAPPRSPRASSISPCRPVFCPRASAAPVANSRQVSLVEVSPSTVMQLNVVLTCSSRSSCKRFRLDRRVGEDEAQHGRHVGRDHAGALAEAVDGDARIADLRRARRELRIGVGRQDGARRGFEAVGFRRLGEIAQEMREFARVHRLADDAGRGEIDLVRLAVRRRPWRARPSSRPPRHPSCR